MPRSTEAGLGPVKDVCRSEGNTKGVAAVHEDVTGTDNGELSSVLPLTGIWMEAELLRNQGRFCWGCCQGKTAVPILEGRSVKQRVGRKEKWSRH